MLSIWIVEGISTIDPVKSRETSVFMDITILQKQLLDEIMLMALKYILVSDSEAVSWCTKMLFPSPALEKIKERQLAIFSH